MVSSILPTVLVEYTPLPIVFVHTMFSSGNDNGTSRGYAHSHFLSMFTQCIGRSPAQQKNVLEVFEKTLFTSAKHWWDDPNTWVAPYKDRTDFRHVFEAAAVHWLGWN